MSRLTSAVLPVLLLLGCSSSIAARRPLTEDALDEINDAVGGHSGTITLRRGAKETASFAEDPRVGSESTEWSEPLPTGGAIRKTAPTEAVRAIEVVKRGRGAAEGLGLGVLFGSLAGAAVGIAAGDKWCIERSPCQPFPMGVGAAGGALAGLLIGPLIGVAIGHRLTVDFENPPSSPPTGTRGAERRE